MKKVYGIIFILLIAVAVYLRFWQLGSIPEGFHSDEAAYGYNAYSILKTGRDEYGTRLPLVLKSFGDNKAAVDSYLAIPFIYFYGLHEWTVRAPSALFGIFFILLTYVFVLRLSKDPVIALISMSLAVISPIGILLSRVQSDPLICATFFFLGIYCLLEWINTRKLLYLFISVALIVLSFFTYTITRIFAVPFLLLIGFVYWRTFNVSSRQIFIGVYALICIIVAGLYIAPSGSYFSQVSVFSSNRVQLPLDEEIREDGTQNVPLVLTRMLHNKVIGYGNFLAKNYADYLSYDFLFRQANEPMRERVPHRGVLMFIDLPFLLVGIYMAFRKRHFFGKLAIAWILLVPAVLSISTIETPNVHRFILAMIPIYFLIAFGIVALYRMINTRYKYLYVSVLVAVFSLNLLYDQHNLFVHQPIHAPIHRNASEKALALYLKDIYKSYDVVVSQKVLAQMLFFWPIDPAIYQKEGSPRDTDNAWYRNILFVNDTCPSHLGNIAVSSLVNNKILYVNKGECSLSENDKVIATIKYKNSLNAYYLVEKNK